MAAAIRSAAWTLAVSSAEGVYSPYALPEPGVSVKTPRLGHVSTLPEKRLFFRNRLRVVPVVRGVEEVDIVVLVLVCVAPPAVKYVSSIRVQVDKPADS